MALRLPESIYTSVQWTRTAVLVMAIIIVAFSLSIYSSHTIPVFSLFSEQQSFERDSTFLLEMVQDRRLISTMVAAQASIFCPLFLLLSSNNQSQHLKHTSSNNNSRSFLADLICSHILMPSGLALSWVFCIMFDRKTMAVLSSQLLKQTPQSSWGWGPLQDMCLLDRSDGGNYWPCMVVNTMHGCKYLIVCVLLLEIELVIAGVIYARFCRPQIQLPTDDAEEKGQKNCV